MSHRVEITKKDPAAMEAMMALEKYLGKSSLTPIQRELIKIRASQINGCAFCINMHTRDARALGETEQRIYALSAWQDTPFFTETERAILALTESVTLIQHKVSAEVYAAAAAVLDEKLITQVIMAVITINAWNRIAISTEMMPPLN